MERQADLTEKLGNELKRQKDRIESIKTNTLGEFRKDHVLREVKDVRLSPWHGEVWQDFVVYGKFCGKLRGRRKRSHVCL